MIQLKELHNSISEQKEGMSVMHQLLGNETLTYLNTIMAESAEKVDFIKMVESVFQNN